MSAASRCLAGLGRLPNLGAGFTGLSPSCVIGSPGMGERVYALQYSCRTAQALFLLDIPKMRLAENCPNLIMKHMQAKYVLSWELRLLGL